MMCSSFKFLSVSTICFSCFKYCFSLSFFFSLYWLLFMLSPPLLYGKRIIFSVINKSFAEFALVGGCFYFFYILLQKDTKRVIRIRKLKKNRQSKQWPKRKRQKDKQCSTKHYTEH